MTSLEHLANAVRQYQRGLINAEELANKFWDLLAGDRELETKDADDVAALIPPAVRGLVAKQIAIALSPGYIRQAFVGDALRETAREQAWAAALKPLLP